MAINNHSGNRRTITGSKRAEVERDILKKSGLLAKAEGFSKFTLKPIDRAYVELEVHRPGAVGESEDDGQIRLEVIVGFIGDIPKGEQAVHIWLLFDPKTGHFKIEHDSEGALVY